MNNIFSYETVGNSSYLVATFANGQGLINYQAQMLINNDIKNIVKANKRQKNEDIQMFYNITSKVSLKQSTEISKISKLNLISIIEGALTALEDIEEYQLASSGVIFDEEYIFIKPGSFEPNFIYVPNSTEDVSIAPLKKFVLKLIMESKVEVSNDNFIQVMLDALNNHELTVKELRDICIKYKSQGGTAKRTPVKEATPVSNSQPVGNSSANAPVNNINIPVSNNNAVEQQGNGPKINIPGMNNSSNNQQAQPGSIPRKKDKKIKGEKPEKEKNPKKLIFELLQLVALAIIVGLSMSGILNDANGKLNLTYLFVVVLVVGTADFILYRELFVNNKNEDSKVEKKKKEKTAPKKENGPAIPKKVPTAIPGKPPVMGSKENNDVKVPASNAPVQNQVNSSVNSQEVNYSTVQPVMQQPIVPVYPTEISDFESEDTVVLDDNNSGVAYLEYYENGLATRININKEYIVVGKLRGQCDFVITNNKISKMHAEFINRNGEYFVKDYNSTNGTYINGSNQRIQSNTEYPIFNGDRITLANVDLTFRC